MIPQVTWPNDMWTHTLAQARELDSKDILKNKRESFALPNNKIYLDGNSLGPASYAAQTAGQSVINAQWQTDLITSWNVHDWIRLPQIVGAQIAPIIGAQEDCVIACDSISINLYKLLHSALNLQPDRHVVMTQKGNFPTDGYIAQGLMAHRSGVCLVYVDEKDIIAQLDESIAVLMLTHVNYKTGYMLDMRQITQAAHELGILVIWDLAHSAGAVELSLDNDEVDFAVGCGYKYLNGGPGAPAFVYVNSRYHSQLRQPLSGWMGHARAFAFEQDYVPADGINSLLCGTPNIISMAVLKGALTIFNDVNMADIRQKSLGLSAFMMSVIQQHPVLQAFELITDMDDAKRGSQIALAHPDAYSICQAWIEQGVIADFRAPNILRVGFAPLYISYCDVLQAVDRLAYIMQHKTYQAKQYQIRNKVT
jgi:kynureninase